MASRTSGLRILFAHQNFPGQYKHLLRYLAEEARHELVFLTQRQNMALPGVKQVLYKATREASAGTHPYLRSVEAAILNAQAVYRAASQLKQQGFKPDLLIGHNGWGETLYLKELFPHTPLLSYFEFFYRADGSDIGFDPEYPASIDTRLRTHSMNAVNLMGLEIADRGQTPTRWQKTQYPACYHEKISVIHEGVDTAAVKPDPSAFVILKKAGVRLTPQDEVVTYVARNLEPYRGFHSFMRAVPDIQRRRPKAHVIIVGGNEVSYGSRLPNGETYRKRLLAEVGEKLDFQRLHFLGRIPYAAYLKLLQVSAAHVYLTYPFVLSWSMLEAMSAGCLVIGSKTPPVEEVIEHGRNGLLVDFFSPAQIADAVDAALDHPERMQPLRHQARQTIVERYDLASICLPQQLALIEELLGGAQRSIAEQPSQAGSNEAVSEREVA